MTRQKEFLKLGFYMAILWEFTATVFVFAIIGYFLDKALGTATTMTASFLFLGFISSIYSLYKKSEAYINKKKGKK